MSVINSIKERVTVQSFAIDTLGITIQNTGRGISPFGGSNQTECAYYEKWFYDFKSGKGGDVIDLCALSKFNGNKGAAISFLSDMLGLSAEKNDKWVAYTQNLCNYIQKCHEELTQEQKEYLAKRKISQETISRLKIGSTKNGRILIPYWKNSYISYFITRGENPKYKKAPLNDLNENVIWGLHTLNRCQKDLYICEGAFDAISFDQEGMSVVASMGGYFNKTQKEYLKNICAMFENVYMCFDIDEAGKLFIDNLSDFFILNKIKFNVLEDLKGNKDISAFYESGGDLKDIQKFSTVGINFYAKRIKDENEIKDSVMKFGKFLDKFEMVNLCNALCETGNWDDKWLKDIFKSAQLCPSEDNIAKHIINKYHIKFSDFLGFYEFMNGHWQTVSETKIKKYIADELGRHRSGSKISSISNLLRSECYFDGQYNKLPYINFQNGILDLESGELLPHSPNYLVSYQNEYDYDPSKVSQDWARFIMSISANDSNKAQLLQEMAGYILFPNTCLQKAFFLMGEGSNGKSVYLNTLSKLFDKKSVTSMEMGGLAESFQRISLATSILNIATESHTSFEEGERVFKKAVVGDPINGCFKNKDFLTFSPRTKFFTSCNKFMSSMDNSDGFLRRICFIKFSVKYVENPTNSNEVLIDKQIQDKLDGQLSAIFNWAYEGYKKLKKTMTFTILEEQKAIMEDYIKLIDPIYSFVNDIMDKYNSAVTFIEKEQLFSEYKEWCLSCNHHAQSKHKFSQSLRYASTIKDFKVYEANHGGKRGWIIEKQVA